MNDYKDITTIDPKYWGRCGWIFLNSIALTYDNKLKESEIINGNKSYYKSLVTVFYKVWASYAMSPPPLRLPGTSESPPWSAACAWQAKP